MCHRNTSPAWRSPRRDLVCGSPWAPRGTSGDPRVSWVGIEPTLCRFKKPVQSQHLLPTRGHCGPTLWNRTRTSRASAERADQLRKSGKKRCTFPVGGTRSAPRHDEVSEEPSTSCLRHGCLAWHPSSSSLFSCHERRWSTPMLGVRRTHLGPRCFRGTPRRTCRVTRSGLVQSRSRVAETLLWF